MIIYGLGLQLEFKCLINQYLLGKPIIIAGPLSGMVSDNIKEIKLTKNPQIVGQEQLWIGTDFGAQVVRSLMDLLG